MPRSHRCSVDVTLPFADGEISVSVTGIYHPYERAFTPRGEYAPIDPPEPASFEYEKIEWWNPKTTVLVDITAMVPPDQEAYISDLAQYAYENGGYGEPDPDAARDEG